MKNSIILILSTVVLFTFSGCNETKDPFEKDNQAPVIEIKSPYSEVFNEILVDSVKLGKTYKLGFKIKDEQKSLILNTTVSNSWKLEQGDGFIQLTPDKEGEANISVSTEDCYSLTASKSMKLVCFKNLGPVANAKCDVIAINHPFERKINALASIDRDKKFGGGIRAYEFTITGNKPVINNKGFLMYIFPKKGTYRVKVRVQDLDDVWSEDFYFDAVIQ